jgi:uncharacterized RDD family membrane protein YckC
MKCPKCGYLGFETSERCRNCGYDFSLALEVGPPDDELPLRSSAGAGAPMGDFDLSAFDTSQAAEEPGPLDLDRLIGDQQPDAESTGPTREASRAARAPGAPSAPGTPGAPGRTEPHPTASSRTRSHPVAPGAPALPLFGGDDDTPLITSPRPLRPPLSVRRTTPEIPRVRPRSHQSSAKHQDGDLTFQIDPDQSASGAAPQHPLATPADALAFAPRAARLGAAIVDVVLLGMINSAVVYLTLALAGLTWQESAVLPRIPLVAFLAILNGGYVTVFIAAAGQTIGKMVTGVRVIREDGQRVSIAGAVVRALGCAGSLLTFGLGYLPAFISADRRALQDRIAGTRVVRAR